MSQIEVLTSIHKECGPFGDWEALSATPPPLAPIQEHRRAGDVISRRDGYSPGFLDKLLGKASKQMEAFALELLVATRADEQEFTEKCAAYESALSNWRDQTQLAQEVLSGSSEAYSRVLAELAPFSEMSDLGSLLTFQVRGASVIEVSVSVNADRVIPHEMKSLTATGRLSSKAMPKARFNEIYADYVAGCLLRVAREAFALLPLDVVLATAWADVFDSRTGHTENHAILSAAITRSTVKRLNFERLDPSDAIENFLHRGDFIASRKSGAFAPIVPLTIADLSPDSQPTRPGTHVFPTVGDYVSAGNSNPFSERWAEALKKNQIEFGFLCLTANQVAGALNRDNKDTFTVSESREIASAVQEFGYCLEPDPRFGAGNYWGSQELGIFPPVGGPVEKPSAHFLGASALLQLCLLVAAADGTVERSELDRFRVFIEAQHQFSPQEHQRLIVLETLLARNPAAAKVTLGRTAKRVPKEKHHVIAQFLVEVAAADSVISPKEHKALGRIFAALDLPQEILDTLIRGLATPGGEVVIQEPSADSSGEKIPLRKAAGRDPNALVLDMSRIAAISAETNEVIGLLARAMEEPEDNSTVASTPTQIVTPSLAPMPTNQTPGPSQSPASFPHLEARFHPAIRELLQAEQWTRAAFDDVARRHQLMPFGLMEALNEWSNEYLGDQLLEGEDIIIVHRQLLSNQSHV
ncbi:MAG TPA: tellurite resistance TerB C-terminal domain-containing protein [Verrucomicrobiota bacterium]|nr:tellurite resistance TerB C-terminal domain-containing protein [Verrucomicrobiota bacterium]